MASHIQLARVELYPPHPAADRHWRPSHGLGPTSALQVRRLEGPYELERAPARVTRHHPGAARRGLWGVAVLTRLPVLSTSVVDLGLLRSDKARRVVAVVDVEVGGRTVTVFGAHMAHLSAGSPIHFVRLRRALPGPGRPAVVAGDMNLWGPPTVALLGRWRRAARGRTWPAWQPIAQPDHILVNSSLAVRQGEVVGGDTGSDHRPVRARLALATEPMGGEPMGGEPMGGEPMAGGPAGGGQAGGGQAGGGTGS